MANKEVTNTKETTNESTKDALVNNGSPFAQAANMNVNSAVGVLAQAAQLAQGAGILTVNDAVLVARALELVSKPNETA